jgi:hypothetical protein
MAGWLAGWAGRQRDRSLAGRQKQRVCAEFAATRRLGVASREKFKRVIAALRPSALILPAAMWPVPCPHLEAPRHRPSTAPTNPSHTILSCAAPFPHAPVGCPGPRCPPATVSSTTREAQQHAQRRV